MCHLVLSSLRDEAVEWCSYLHPKERKRERDRERERERERQKIERERQRKNESIVTHNPCKITLTGVTW